MKQTSTIARTFYKKCLVLFLAIFSFSFSQTVLGHSVDSYSGNCASGPQYRVTAVVSNVNNSSNYRWQWKNSSNAWVCFVNGANTINSVSYNVSGAVYNLTTNPGPIIFTNPGPGLQGLQIRMVISDGNGVNPCNMPNGNTWTSTNPFVMNVNGTACGANGSIGDRVWLDANANGLQDAAETGGISGVSVQLRNSANTVIATQSTNSSGNYLFTGLAAGTYTVVFPVSVSVGVLTTANVGSNDNIDSDPSTTTGITPNIVLAANQNITNVDAGYKPQNLKLGNRVWYDTDNDGINDASENGIRNVTVRLYKDDNNDNVADGASVATVLTDVNGYYTFSNLSPGNYIVGAVIPNGYMSSSINGGDPDNNTDLDDNGQVAAGTEVRGLAITLTSGGEPTSGHTNNTYDFGMLPDCGCVNSSANKLVNASFENGTTGWSWSSSNGTLTTGNSYVACGSKNGYNDQNSGTARVWQDVTVSAGATVYFSAFAGTHAPGISCSPKLSLIFLNSSNGVISQLDVAVTRVVGDYHDQLEQYSLTGVAPAGTAKVRVQSSITCNTMKLDAFCLTVSATGSIGDFVWEDLNRNGLQDSGELGIGGVAVTLSGTSSATTTTAANGSYHFNNLAAGTYNVTFATPTLPGNTFLPTNSNVGTNDGIDSDPVGGVVSNIVLAAGQVNNTVDAGFYRILNLSGNVWHDVNGMSDGLVNDTRGPNDAVIPTGLKMILVDANTSLVARTTLVLGNGTFSFPNITPGTYILVLKIEGSNIDDPSPFASIPEGWKNTGEHLGLNPGADAVVNGKLTVTVSTVSVTNANFGINFGGDFPIN